jgi:hypothetical protein
MLNWTVVYNLSQDLDFIIDSHELYQHSCCCFYHTPAYLSKTWIHKVRKCSGRDQIQFVRFCLPMSVGESVRSISLQKVNNRSARYVNVVCCNCQQKSWSFAVTISSTTYGKYIVPPTGHISSAFEEGSESSEIYAEHYSLFNFQSFVE